MSESQSQPHVVPPELVQPISSMASPAGMGAATTPKSASTGFANAALAGPRTGRRFWLAVGIGLFSAALAVWSWQQSRGDAAELAKRIQTQETRLLEGQTQFKLIQDALRDSQAKLSILENRVNEAASQQAQLEKLYRALSNDSLDVALADLESVILLAAQQAAAGGSLQGPLIGLQAAETKLERLADPSLLTLKRAVGKDIEKLKLLTAQDTAGPAQKLEFISAQIDQFRLLAEIENPQEGIATSMEKPVEKIKAKGSEKLNDPSNDKSAERPSEKPPASGGFWSRLGDVVLGKGKVVGQDWRDLIRVTRVENPDAALLSPEQVYFVRENLRLRLLNARVALSSRQESVAKADLERARNWLGTYFDKRDKQVLNAQEQLRQILSARATADATVSFESLTVIRNMRSLREAKKP